MLSIHRITGESMLPVLADGDYVVSARRRGGPRAGQLVLVNHPDYGTICKRVAGVEADGSLLLRGENPASVESASLGRVDGDRVVGTVLLTIPARRRSPEGVA